LFAGGTVLRAGARCGKAPICCRGLALNGSALFCEIGAVPWEAFSKLPTVNLPRGDETPGGTVRNSGKTLFEFGGEPDGLPAKIRPDDVGASLGSQCSSGPDDSVPTPLDLSGSLSSDDCPDLERFSPSEESSDGGCPVLMGLCG